jgi:hypothetical protein
MASPMDEVKRPGQRPAGSVSILPIFVRKPLRVSVFGPFLSLAGRIVGEWNTMVCDRLPPINSNKILWLMNG